MKKDFIIVLALFIGVAAAAFAADKAKETKAPATQPTTQVSAKPINKFCAVEQDNEIDPKVPTVTYKGKVIGFCCEDCAPKFLKNPEKYMKTLK